MIPENDGRVASDRAGGPADPSQQAVSAEGAHPSRMAFNVNEYVWLKLTGAGRDILAARERELNRLYMPQGGKWFPETDAEGWSKWQLWEVMREFGAECFNGCKVPFETTILLDTNALHGAIPCDSDGSGNRRDATRLDRRRQRGPERHRPTYPPR